MPVKSLLYTVIGPKTIRNKFPNYAMSKNQTTKKPQSWLGSMNEHTITQTHPSILTQTGFYTETTLN